MSFFNTRPSSAYQQNVRLCMGEVRSARDHQKRVGACFVLDKANGLLVTSKTVVQRATGDPDLANRRIDLYFPQVMAPAERPQVAELLHWDVDAEGSDLVVVCIVSNNARLPDDVREAIIADAADSVAGTTHKFVSFGYREENRYRGLPVRGVIGGYMADSGVDKHFYLDTPHLSDELVGAPVLDWERNLVVGMVTQLEQSSSGPVQQTGLAVDLDGLGHAALLGADFDARYRTRALRYNGTATPPPPQAQPVRIDLDRYWTAQRQREEHQGLGLAPRLPDAVLPLREDMLAQLLEGWQQRARTGLRVLGLIGSSGSGKATLVRRWLDTVQSGTDAAAAVFWWNFHDYPNLNDFVNGFLRFCGGVPLVSLVELGEGQQDFAVLLQTLQQRQIILVLEGLEQLQLTDSDDRYGTLPLDHRVRVLLDFLLAQQAVNSFCIALSAVPLVDWVDRSYYQELTLRRLGERDGVTLLRGMALMEEETILSRLVRDWQGHLLSLVLLAAHIRAQTPNQHPVRLPADLPLASGDHRARIATLLRYINDALEPGLVDLMQIATVFRVPVPAEGLEKVAIGSETQSKTVLMMETTPEDFLTLTQALVQRRLLRPNEAGQFGRHPLVLAFYRGYLDDGQAGRIHRNVGMYYSERFGAENAENLPPSRYVLSEMVYHLNRGTNPNTQDMLRNLPPEYLGGEDFELVNTRYVLLDEIGKGGFAKVYRAYDIERQRTVALKRLMPLLPGEDEDGLRIERFQREIGILSSITHPHIVQALDYKLDNTDDQYLVMPLFTGGTLRDRIAAARSEGRMLPRDEICDLVVKLGSALQAAHDRGIIHRDITPRNILFEADEPFLVDFGLAKPLSAITNTRTVGAGTLIYMAPERKDFESPGNGSKLSDQYELAFVTFEMLTGSREPFNDPNVELDSLTKQILYKAMSHAPEARFDSVQAFVQAFQQRCLPESSSREFVRLPQSTSTTRRIPRIAMLLVAIVIVGGVLALTYLPQFQLGAPTTGAVSSNEMTLTQASTATTPAVAVLAASATPSETATSAETLTPSPTATRTATATPSLTHTATIPPGLRYPLETLQSVLTGEIVLSPWEIDCVIYDESLQLLQEALERPANATDSLFTAGQALADARIVGTVATLCAESDRDVLVLDPDIYQELATAINALELGN